MKTETTLTQNPSWPAGVPFFDSAREPRSSDNARPTRQASVGPIELRIGSSDGPAAIAILE